MMPPSAVWIKKQVETLISRGPDESEAVDVIVKGVLKWWGIGGYEGNMEYFYKDSSEECTIQATLHFVRGHTVTIFHIFQAILSYLTNTTLN